MTTRNPISPVRRSIGAVALVAVLLSYSSYLRAQNYEPAPPAPPPAPTPPAAPATPNTYTATILVSNGAVAALSMDVNLVNPWGIALGPSTPMWVANNATSTSTLYDGDGVPQQLVVNLPGGTNGPAGATGLVFNGTQDFAINNGVAAAAALFIFDGEGGTVLAWSPNVDPANAIVVYDDGAGGAVYKGLAIAADNGANFLYATDFHNGKVDVFDGAFQKVAAPGGFVDPQLPAGYAPFGIQALPRNGQTVICVTYAQHAPDSDEDVPGPGLGIVNVFDTQGTLLQRLVPAGGNLNAPWGVALAPADFGALSNLLLIGNFGDGTINAYDPNTGAFVDTLRDSTGQPIVIEGLWGMAFGNGAMNQPTNTLYFAAGIADETAGVYGRIDPPAQ